MSSRATQSHILRAALALFNEHGTASVSTRRIAESCGISKGNLQYHYRNKREIIRALFQDAVKEMNAGWYQDHLAPTLDHMAAMFVRQLELILKYRFFYRELADLLRQDSVLRSRFADNRERRLKEVERFLLGLSARGLMSFPRDPVRLRTIVDLTWIVSENWLDYVDCQDRLATVAAIRDGYGAILELLRPYLRNDPQQITRESNLTIERLTSELASERGAAHDPLDLNVSIAV